MKRIFVLLLCFLSLLNFATAEEELSDKSIFSHHIDATVGMITDNGMAPDYYHLQIGYGLEFPNFVGDVKMQVAAQTVSMGIDTSYRFLDFGHFMTDARGFFCLELLINETFATDTFLGLEFFYTTQNIFTMSCELYCGLKTSKIFSLKNVNAICNFDFATGLSFYWNLFDKSQFYFKVKSFEVFHHPKFITPTLTLGVDYKFNENFKGTAEFAARTIDFFTLSSYFDGFIMRMGMEYTF